MEKLFEKLEVWTPSCKNQPADARWVMACSRKNQSFIKNGAQKKWLDKVLPIEVALLAPQVQTAQARDLQKAGCFERILNMRLSLLLFILPKFSTGKI